VQAPGGVAALDLLEQQHVNLVVLDTLPPAGMDAVECCSRIKGNRRSQLVPVLMLLREQDAENQVIAMASGADQFLSKPFHPEVFRSRVRSLVGRNLQLDETESMLFSLAQAVESRDQGGHCERLAVFSLALGRSMGLNHRQLMTLHLGGYLHDIGKVVIPDSILFKETSLTDDEWAIMRTHTVKGEEICLPVKSLEPVLPIVRSHHERWDGSGYPDGLVGEQIPLLARVLQLADIYDALTTARPYKPALDPDTALQVMHQETRRGWRDPDLMALFNEVHRKAISKAAEYAADNWHSFEAMQASLRSIQRHVAADAEFELSERR